MNAAFKQTEIGLLPTDWEVRRIGEIAKVHDGTHQTPKYVPVGIPFYSVEQVTSGDFSNTKFISLAEHRFLTRKFKIERGDVLMTRIGSIGDCRFVDWDVDASFYVSLALLKVKDADAAFLTQYSKSRAFQAEVELHSLPSAIPKKINLGPISDVLVAYPPRPEQRAIAEALGDVDELIGSLERLIAKKRDIKQAVMQQLLTGKTRLPGFTGDWSEKLFGELFDFYGGLSASRDQLNDAEGYCYLHYGDIHSRAQTWIDVSQERTSIPKLDVELKKVSPTALLRDGDVVFVDASEDDDGTNKHVVVQNPDNEPFISGLHTIVARQKGPLFSREWLSYCFNSEFIKRQFRLLAVGTKVKGVNKTTIKQIVFRYPDEDEQQAIGMILRDIDAEVASLQLRLSKTRDIKQGMMQQLLTGKVRLV